MDTEPSLDTPQVKICGLTRIEEALACVEHGADAVGFVFYARSPRHLTVSRARALSLALPAYTARVGVFVDEGWDFILERVEQCGLTAVQLHGREPAQLVRRLRAEGIGVIKAVFAAGQPGITEAASYGASAILVECAGGVLPGGNGRSWDWSAAAGLSGQGPMILAGGLTPENVSEAIRAALPNAVDVSSGVESSPGRKDMDKVKRFLEAVRRTPLPARRIFS